MKYIKTLSTTSEAMFDTILNEMLNDIQHIDGHYIHDIKFQTKSNPLLYSALIIIETES